MRETRFLLPLMLAIGAMLATSVAEPATGGENVPSELSGVWRGTYSIRQAGSCGISVPDRRFPVSSIVLVFEVETNGNFSAWLDREGERSPDPLLTGSIAADLGVDATKHHVAYCKGVREKHESSYKGSVEQKKKRNELKLRGNEAVCGEKNCKFLFVYKLSKGHT